MRGLLLIALLSICQFSWADFKAISGTQDNKQSSIADVTFYENESKVCLQGTLEKHSFDFSDPSQNISIRFKLKLDHHVGLRQTYNGQTFSSSFDQVVLTTAAALVNELQIPFDKKETIRLCGSIRFPEASPEGQDAPVLDLR